MREGYIVTNRIDYSLCKFIEVTNFKSLNEVLNLGWINENKLNKSKNKYTVGVWKIKSK
jgi:hypothetical protein